MLGKPQCDIADRKCFEVCVNRKSQITVESLKLLCSNKNDKAPTVRQKGKSQNGCYKETKHAKFSKNEHFLPPDTLPKNTEF